MISKLLFSSLYGLAAYASAIPITEQQVLGSDTSPVNSDFYNIGNTIQPSRQLFGRFLHVTDFHLDLHYKPGTSGDQVCHHGKGSAGSLGAEGSECDSPRSLVDETFRWIEKHLKDEIDFVLWTGDSARHDNDEKIPRTTDEIVDLNEMLADKFIDIFKDDNTARGLSIPIIPTFGNNDIMPHNIFKEGPNRWTRKFADIWGKFIPEHQRHTFEEGGWFSAEVIPNKLAAISLNTMYFFESNSAVDGCAVKSEPGYEHMEWLRIQLELLRVRNMKAILIGHVPPARAGTKRNWDETCWQKYTLWLNRFRDVVVGSVYGHMNIDHFMLQDSHKINIIEDRDASSAGLGDASGDFAIKSRSSYLSSLRESWAKMPSPPDTLSGLFSSGSWFSSGLSATDSSSDTPSQISGGNERQFLKKIGGPWAERYSVSLVSPSVVPNYFPTLRVVEYNITGLENVALWADTPYSTTSFESLAGSPPSSGDEQSKKKKKKKKKPNFKVPEHPSPSAPPGPAYSNQALTWLGYAQYYANLTMIYDQTESSRGSLPSMEDPEKRAGHLELYQLEYDTRDDKVYKLDDLTVRSYFKLATRIAKKNPNKEDTMASDTSMSATNDDGPAGITAGKKKHTNRVWRTFLDRAFVGSLSDDELDDIQE